MNIDNIYETMSSTSINISNTLDAIKNGIIIGDFSLDRTQFNFKKLTYVDAKGKNKNWSIIIKLLSPDNKYIPIEDWMISPPFVELNNYKAEIIVESYQDGGKIRDAIPTYISTGKNIGKANATNVITQAFRDALGLYNKQSKRTIAPTTSSHNTFDKMPPPMLAKKLDDSPISADTFCDGVTVQRKMNGVHFIAFMTDDGKVKCYSRSGTEYLGQDHICDELRIMIANAPLVRMGEYGAPFHYGEHPRPYFAGELYLHGEPLNWISGQARREDDAKKLQFHIFDVFFPYAKHMGHDMISRNRQLYIDEFFNKNKDLHTPHIIRVENFHVKNEKEMMELSKKFLDEKYEGAIARIDSAGYKYSYNGYHSANLLKIKPIFDDEFEIVGYTQGTRGKDVGAVIWKCKTTTGEIFTVVPKDLSLEQRYKLFECLGKIVKNKNGKNVTLFERDISGLPLTIEYRELSAKTNKPLQAKAVSIRSYEAGPDKDPIKKILNEC